ncbi:MAG: vitamin B12-dependent ribonucleotide reductase, partial [Pseudomonadota bacterium]
DYIFRELAISYLDRDDLAHVEPEGARFDAMGRGETEGKMSDTAPEETAASSALAMIRQVSSTGYLRKRLPLEFQVYSGGQGESEPTKPVGHAAGHGAGAAVVAGATIALERDLVAEARLKGYEGDACGECGNFTLVRNGTCLKCDSCGATSGCS